VLNLPDKPFQQLVAYANRSLAVAPGLPEQKEIAPEWTGIAFELGGLKMTVPMGPVSEILTIPPHTRLPSVQEWVRGLANVRGKLLPLLDMEAFLGGSLHRDRKSHRVLVLEMGDLCCGLIVSSVLGMQTFPIDVYSDQVPADAPESLRPYLSGHYNLDGQQWAVFNPEKLVQDERFYNVAD
jgi:twitching motility protein PilI